MKKLLLRALSLALILQAALVVAAAQTGAAGGEKAKPKAGAEGLKKYVGRYELEVGLAPVSSLDVTLEGGELWAKPSNLKKRRLLRRPGAGFADEVAGTPVRFRRDDEGRVTGVTFVHEGETYTARRVELPPPSLKGNTTFRLEGHPEASVVALAGSFNNWDQSQLLFAREGGAWVCRVDLDPGVYTYKLVVDGNWLLDPANPATQEDEAGNINNVLEVKPL